MAGSSVSVLVLASVEVESEVFDDSLVSDAAVSSDLSDDDAASLFEEALAETAFVGSLAAPTGTAANTVVLKHNAASNAAA
ncbi:hypothetical protein [Lacticaseibacillus manihotivorans]|uniref:hypothetical protein n=1 Tax=Lacticaseibacillus manihotivorans TaxID=88233 RepID=UPI001FB32049|nr:hypothetical protein [Lacticaseibacillus manihotivorans]